MGPLSSSLTRLYGIKGWMALGAFAATLLVMVALLNLAVPESSPFHLSTYWVTLVGKIMCYAIVAIAMDLIWGYCGILSLGHGLFFALGGYAMGMYLMRQIGREGQYQSNLPDFMVFLDWKEFPWQWWGTDHFLWAAFLVVAVPGLIAFVFGLLHGFGFAGALRAIGLPEGNIPAALLFFNLGIEAGQIAFVAAIGVMFVVLRAVLPRVLSHVERLSPYLVGSIASYWLIVRVLAIVQI